MTATLVDSGQLRPIPIHNRMEPCPFPIDPVFEIVAPWRNGETPYGINERRQGERVAVALCLGTNTQRVTRWDSRGLDAYEADEVAASLSLHPVSIWPDWFEHAPAEEQVLATEASERRRAVWREAHRRHKGAGPLVAVDGARLRRCRKEARYKVAPFAEELGISANQLYRIERGYRMAKSRADLVRRASDILGVDQGTLIVGGSTDADRAAAWAVHDELRTPLSELFLQWCQQEAPEAS